MPVAFPVSREKIKEIARSTLVHVTAKSNLDTIIENQSPSSTNIGENCTVNLVGGQGWSVAPFKLLRDYSVLDLEIKQLKNWGRYTYFFLGEPSGWAITKNISPLKRWNDVKDEFGIIRVEGAQLTSKGGRILFHRPDDNVVVVRGGYRGPAAVAP